jgi:hypothetical protein
MTDQLNLAAESAPDHWLSTFAPGFAHLGNDERDAITHFVFLWSLFEARMLTASASPKSIIALAKRLDGQPLRTDRVLDEALAYFKRRYYSNGQFNYSFETLYFRPGDHRSLVEDILSGKKSDRADRLAATMLVIYRLRNNLFHGLKWSYDILEQRDNFVNANRILMCLLEMGRDQRSQI